MASPVRGSTAVEVYTPTTGHQPSGGVGFTRRRICRREAAKMERISGSVRRMGVAVVWYVLPVFIR